MVSAVKDFSGELATTLRLAELNGISEGLLRAAKMIRDCTDKTDVKSCALTVDVCEMIRAEMEKIHDVAKALA